LVAIPALFCYLITVVFSKNFTIEPQYADTITGKYAAKVEALDFGEARETAEVEFLNERESRYFAEDEDMEMLSLRYKDTSYALNIILLRERNKWIERHCLQINSIFEGLV
ncbi:hypothetical protein ANCDUO_06244, partial [Ancylostoma duodenale]